MFSLQQHKILLEWHEETVGKEYLELLLKKLQKEIHEKLQKAEEERKLKEKERRCKKPESSFTPIFSFPDIPVSDLSYRSAWASDIMESICEHYLDQGEDPTDAVMQFKQTISEWAPDRMGTALNVPTLICEQFFAE